MRVTDGKGRLRGKRPELDPAMKRTGRLDRAGEHSTAELARRYRSSTVVISGVRPDWPIPTASPP